MDCRNKISGNLLDEEISELPDEILVSIISLVSLKEAARTSVLSSRWRYLWTFFSGDMHFNQDEWKLDSRNLVARINQIMKLHKGGIVDVFSVDFKEVHPVEDIDNFIENVSKRSLNMLKLTNIHLPAVTGWSFDSLKILHLVSTNVSDDVMQHVLSNTPNLEELDLSRLQGLRELSVPSSSLVKLKKLIVYRCYGLEKIYVSSRILDFFTYVGDDVDIDLKEVPQLNTLCFGNSSCKTPSFLVFRMCEHFFLGELETLDLWYVRWAFLHINMEIMKNCRLPKLKLLHLFIRQPPVFGELRLILMDILEGAPVLHTLEVEFVRSRKYLQHKLWKMSEYELYMRLNRSIKVVKVIKPCEFLEPDVGFLKNLTHSIQSLEKLILAAPCCKAITELPYEKGFLPPGVELVVEI